MDEKIIDTRSLDQFVGKLETLLEYDIPVLEEAMREAMNVGLAAVIERAPVTFGNLRGNINTRVLADKKALPELSEPMYLTPCGWKKTPTRIGRPSPHWWNGSRKSRASTA